MRGLAGLLVIERVAEDVPLILQTAGEIIEPSQHHGSG